MKITEAIERRWSVRTYTGEPLDTATVQKITDYIATLTPPFGAKCRIELIRTAVIDEPVRLGTYGAIRGASDFMALVIQDDTPMSQEGAAYMMEQAILYCTSLGLGTCWLAGFFDRGNFKKQLALRPGEKLRCVSPVGYAADKPHLSISTIFSGSKPSSRKPFSTIFFNSKFDDPLTGDEAGTYARPLEMVRLAPSANNKQSWRVVVNGRALHFYKTSSMGYESLDMGIALCHFEQACIELGVEGRYQVLTDVPEGKKATYVISWITEK